MRTFADDVTRFVAWSVRSVSPAGPVMPVGIVPDATRAWIAASNRAPAVHPVSAGVATDAASAP
jgi:hypothetical protein